MEVAAVVVLGSFEHQVLEQVREPRVSEPLILGTDVKPKVDRNDGTRVIFMKENVEAVPERVSGERDIQFRKLPQVSIWLP
jgi:hypothetical protein